MIDDGIVHEPGCDGKMCPCGMYPTAHRCWSCGAEYQPVIVHSMMSGAGGSRVPTHDRPLDGEPCPAGGWPEPRS